MPALSFSTQIMHLGKDVSDAAYGLVSRAIAPTQGGLLQGQNPAALNNADPIRLWIIQLFIIICFTQLLGLFLSRIRQPRVISEVIGGILLGPTAMGRINGFTNNIFPAQSVYYLNLTANIGLVLFLFVVGMEVDTRIIRRNGRASLAISAVGMVLPFGLGAAVSVPMYALYINESIVSFGNYLLFAGVAMSITAFPVLCRILTECKLLPTAVGTVTLAAGVGNDIVGWILLALTVALVNATTGVMAVYILLCTVGWALVLLFPIKWGLNWLARKTGSFESGPTPFMMTLVLLLVFASAFFTDVIGVHAIFGGFLAGIAMPHEGGFRTALVEKFEDLVTLLFIPIYFALSGLSTNLGLLNRGVDWGYIVLLCVIAFVGKFVGCAATAFFFGFKWREAGAIGTLMSCKGLVELIVLNVGLSAGILDTRIFSMFVVMALVLTFMTTPLTLMFYPPKYHVYLADGHLPGPTHRHSEAEAAHPTPRATTFNSVTGTTATRGEEQLKSRFAVVLSKMEHLPALMTLTQLLQPPPTGPATAFDNTRASSIDESEKDSTTKQNTGRMLSVPVLSTTPVRATTISPHTPPVRIDALRLIELTERASALFKASVTDELVRSDPLVNIFRTYGHLNRIPISASVSVVNYDSFPSSVNHHVQDHASELVIIPWGPQSMGSSVLEQATTGASGTTTYSGPLSSLFSSPTSTSAPDGPQSLLYSQFARRVFAEAPSDVALFIDRGLSPSETAGGYGQHIFFPFFGGPDDRAALALVVQLCAHPAISATVIRVTKSDEPTEVDLQTPAATHLSDNIRDNIASTLNAGMTLQSTHFPDTVYGQNTTQVQLASSAADDIAWETFARPSGETAPRSPFIEEALTRVNFSSLTSSQPLRVLVQRAHQEERESGSWKTLVVVVGRGRRLATESHHAELAQLLSEHGRETSINPDVRKTIGDVATAFAVSGSRASLLIMQSAEAR
ncbi:hypothetical protein DACRYDRAFT_92500 [Dacryopinax primogenitus]|uniref:Cation/H+ exchanger transmembrane domain-containing protein n=1 Tax=Dacryopinax primogenitus (strain DJM 731) TaxID=1858805 RepID=M5GFS5_DACPD|nr:uncharacterized protein DACRYDRAFT_92500 [Dacryopinax primogenitus]EJU06552.1 hypothetical protein DACRYDRAFT_92500 [Dacryopinax primogenitus]